jgi:hypothetical protein
MEKAPIQGYGTIDIMVTGSENNRKRTSKKILPIRNVAYCQDFTTNLVSLSQLHKRGVWWDNRPGYNYFSIGFVAVLEKH